MDERRYPGFWVGNVVNQPECTVAKTGTARLAFRLAENRGHRAESGQWEQTGTSYYDVVVWGSHAARLAELLQKGDAVDIRGDLEVRHQVDEDGRQQIRVRIAADKVLPDWTRMKVQIDRTPRQSVDHSISQGQEVGVDPKQVAATPTPTGLPPMKEWPMPAHPDAGMSL